MPDPDTRRRALEEHRAVRRSRAFWGRMAIILGCVAAPVLGWLMWDSLFNYRTVQARVIAVEHGCALSKVTRNSRITSRDDRGPYACEEAQRMKADESFANHTLHQVQTATLRYTSPADGAERTVTHTDFRHDLPTLTPGSTLEVEAHIHEPATWRPAG